MDLRSFVPHGRVSTGMLVSYSGRFVWAVSQEKYWLSRGDKCDIALIGIGGGQEPHETIIEALQRESVEEACSEVSIIGSPETIWVDAEGRGRRESLVDRFPEQKAPLLIWQRRVTLKDEHGRPYDIDYINPVFRGEFVNTPRPGAETPGLMLIRELTWLGLYNHPKTWQELEGGGAAYLGTPLPPNAVFHLQGSALFLARYWDMLLI